MVGCWKFEVWFGLGDLSLPIGWVVFSFPKVGCFGPFQVWSWFSLGLPPRKKTSTTFRHMARNIPGHLLGVMGWENFPWGVFYDVSGHDLLLLDINYWSTMYIHISSYYTDNCVHEYSLKCLCIFYAKCLIYLIDLEEFT